MDNDNPSVGEGDIDDGDEADATQRAREKVRRWTKSGSEKVKKVVERSDEALSSDPRVREKYIAAKEKTSEGFENSAEKTRRVGSATKEKATREVHRRLLTDYREAIDSALDQAIAMINAQAMTIEALEQRISRLEADDGQQ